MTPNELALALQGYAGKAAATIMEQAQKIEELEAVVAAFSRPVAYPPIAEVPVRDVTHIETEDDPA